MNLELNNFQRVGAISNAHVGREFEESVKTKFEQEGMQLREGYEIGIGIRTKKIHKFDLGGEKDGQSVIIECKSHRWTKGNNIPSAKLTVWNEAMYYFTLISEEYRKIFCVLRDYSVKRAMTLAEYYINVNKHLIPKDVEIHEYDEVSNTLKRLI